MLNRTKHIAVIAENEGLRLAAPGHCCGGKQKQDNDGTDLEREFGQPVEGVVFLQRAFLFRVSGCKGRQISTRLTTCHSGAGALIAGEDELPADDNGG